MDTNMLQLLRDLLPLLIPVLLIQLGLVIYALLDLSRRNQTHGPRWAWAAGLVLSGFAFPSGILVAAAYLGWGRHIEVYND